MNPDAVNPSVTGQTPFICANAEYTPGNLGKGWNELDLVPQRMTTERAANSDTASYDLRVTADSEVPGPPIGYDFISIPTINDALSDNSCVITVTDPDGPDADAIPDLQGVGTDTIYRNIRVTQAPDTTCVVDVDFRLAIGSHLYPGSSLHTHINNENGGTQGVGNKDNSIPVNEILPQSISKDMTAVRDANTMWTVLKTPTPAVVNLGDTCDPATVLSAGVSIRVEWDKVGTTPSGDATINVKIYANNPAHRVITVNAVDKTYRGTGQLLADLVDTRGTGNVNVVANTNNQLLLDATFDVHASGHGLQRRGYRDVYGPADWRPGSGHHDGHRLSDRPDRHRRRRDRDDHRHRVDDERPDGPHVQCSDPVGRRVHRNPSLRRRHGHLGSGHLVVRGPEQ